MRNPEIRKIQYKGISTSPDGYLCPDGELAGAIGVENLTGALTSASRYAPKRITLLETDEDSEAYVVYIHKTPQYTHAIICYNKTSWAWIDVTEGFPETFYQSDLDDNRLFVDGLVPEINLDEVSNVCAIGNTLMIIARDIHYLLFKFESEDEDINNAHYHNLGTHIPEIPITFGLVSQMQRYYDHNEVLGVDEHTEEEIEERRRPWLVEYLPMAMTTGASDHVPQVFEENRRVITTAIMAKVNSLVNNCNKKGLFCLPFLVRYAVKLYDNSITMHSAPVYMPVSDITEDCAGIWPVLDWFNNDRKAFRFHIDYIRSYLDYAVEASAKHVMLDWKDIVKSVEIYISAPLYTYDQSGDIENILGGRGNSGLSSDSFYNKNMPKFRTISKTWYGGLNGVYKYRKVTDLCEPGFFDDSAYVNERQFYDARGMDTKFYYPLWVFQLPKKSMSDYYEQVKKNGAFYLLASINIDDLSTTRKKVPVKDDYLPSLVARLPMIDEYQSHDQLHASVSYVYNSRLNLAGISRTLYGGFSIKAMVPYQSVGSNADCTLEHDFSTQIQMTVEIVEDGRRYVVKSRVEAMPWNFWWQYLYYPNPSCKTFWIGAYKFKAEEHELLNGSIWMEDKWMSFERASDYAQDVLPPASTGIDVRSSSKLYTSNAYNPWMFEVENINTVGNGEILALSSAAKALTDMQFSGEHLYSMYIFTTQGIWGAKVSGTGGWTGFEPITRDVVTYPKAICQIDDAVIFPSLRGLMLLQGNTTAVLTDIFNDKQIMKVSEMPGLRRLLLDPELTDLANIFLTRYESEDVTNEMLDALFTPNPKEYFESDKLRLYFDYANQRIVCGRSDMEYSLIFSLVSKTWSTAPWKLVYKPNSYPNCYVMMKTLAGRYFLSELSDRSKKKDDEDYFIPHHAFIITRPIKCEGMGDTLKELESAVHQGRFGRTKVKIIVYGTLDYKKWYLVGSSVNADIFRSHGQYYRAFSIALLLDLDEYDYLDTVTLQLEPRRAGRLHGMGYNR